MTSPAPPHAPNSPKTEAAQTSTNEAQTNETIVGNVEHVGGLSDLRNGHQILF